MAPEPWMSADEIAEHLAVAKDTVYVWIAEKALPADKDGTGVALPSQRGRRLGKEWGAGTADSSWSGRYTTSVGGRP